MKYRPFTYSLIPLLILAAIVFGIYLGRDSLKHHFLTFVSDRLQLSNLDVQGLQLDGDGMRAQSIHISRRNSQQDLKLALEDIKLGFSVFPLNLASLVVARGNLDVDIVIQPHAQTETSDVSSTPDVDSQDRSSSTGVAPQLPPQLIDLESMRIERLTANVQLPEKNKISFDGSADWFSDGTEVVVNLESNNEHITINSDTNLRTVDVQISQPADAAAPARLTMTDPLTSQPQFQLTSTLATLNKWVSRSDLVPAPLRDAVEQFRQSADGFSISSARFDLAGSLAREADWPLGPLSVDVDWTSLRHGDCEISGNLLGTLSSASAKTGTFAVGEGSILANDCIKRSNEKSPSQLQVRPLTGFSVAYDLTTPEDPIVDIDGPINVSIELEKFSASLATDNIQILDAVNDNGLPGTSNGTIVADIKVRDFSQAFDETSVSADNVAIEGSLELLQSSPGLPYELRGDDLEINIERLQSQQPAATIAIDRIKGSVKTSLQLTPSLTDSFQLDTLIDLSMDVAAHDIDLSNGDSVSRLHIADARTKSRIDGKVENSKPTVAMAIDYEANTLSLSDPETAADALSGKAQIKLAETLEVDTTLSIINLTGAAPLPPLAIQKIDGSLKLNSDQLSGNGVATLATDLDAPWKLTKQADRIVVGTSMIASVPLLYEWLEPALGTLVRSVSITEGRVRLDSELEIGENDKSIVATGTATNLSGGFEDIKFDQASVTMNATDLLTQKIDLNVEVANGEFANGTTFQDLSTDMRIVGKRIAIDRFATTTFDADFFFGNLVIGEEDSVPASVVTVNQLDLSVVATELAKEQIEASGKMSGEIPFRITASGVAIDDGHLESDGSGTIAYRSSGSEKNIEGLNNIALQALDNFLYDSVELKLGYTEDGEYLAQFKLSGNNPDLYDGYPIVLNLNVNGQLPGLLRSSLIGGSFDEEILRSLPQDPTRTDN